MTACLPDLLDLLLEDLLLIHPGPLGKHGLARLGSAKRVGLWEAGKQSARRLSSRKGNGRHTTQQLLTRPRILPPRKEVAGDSQQFVLVAA